MRTLIRNILVIMLAFLPATSCMQHNGNIGEFFGTWKLIEMTVDGEPDAAYEGNSFFQFHTDVVRVVTVYPHQLFTNSFGRWIRTDSTLDLDFGFTADSPGEYEAPAGLHMTKGNNPCHIDRLTSREMQLTLHSDGKTIVYSLKKQ